MSRELKAGNVLSAFALLVLAASPLSPVRAQRLPISVAVEITDSTNQLASAFQSALRQLGDIKVVSSSEPSDYVLAGVALCEPNCPGLLSYSVALRLYAPIQLPYMAILVDLAFWKRSLSRPTRDSIETRLWQALSAYEITYGAFVVSWGRQRYEQAVREFVRDIVYRCFDKVRAERRLVRGDTAALSRYFDFYKSRKWIC